MARRLMHRRELSKALLATATGAALLPTAANGQPCMAPCYPQTPAEASAGVTPADPTYPPYNVKRYGAAGDGKTDDTRAIQTAIDVQNNWQVYSAALGNKSNPGPDFAQGGEVYLPGGRYRISRPLLLAPNITLRGACAIRHYGTNYSGSGQLVTVIEAMPTFPRNAYMIDSGIWRLKNQRTGAAVKPYRVTAADDIFNRGADADNAVCNFMQSMTVADLQLDGASTAFGGIRIQGAAFFDIDGVGIIGTRYAGFAFYACFEFSLGRVLAVAPIPLLICSCESMMQDAGECELYAKPTPAWTAGNQPLIDRVFYSFADQVGSWYGLTLKAILVQWSVNVTLGYLSANAGNVGIELYRANVNILHWENEYTRGGVLFLLRKSACRCDGLSTKSRDPLSTGDAFSRLVIREPALISCSTSFTPLSGEARSAFEVQIHNLKPEPDPILGVGTALSNLNLTRIFPADALIDLYASPSGAPSLAGLARTSPTTLDGAMAFIANNPHIRSWRINLTVAQTHTLSSAHSLRNVDVSIVKNSGSDPTIAVHAPLTLINSRLALEFCRLSSNQPAMLLAQGIVNLEVSSASIIIADGSALIAAADNTSAKVIASGFSPAISFGAGSGMCSGGRNGYVAYEDCFANPSVSGTFALEALTSGRVFGSHTRL